MRGLVLLWSLAVMIVWGGTLQAQYEAPHEAGGRPETEAAPERKRPPPVVYSTPKQETPGRTATRPPDYSDYEQLFYQKEMWEQYQEDYQQQHRPQPRPRPRTGGAN